MSMRYPDFQGEVVLLAKIHYANTNLATELQAVATALASDTTTHDRTIQTPPAGLFSDAPAANQSRLTRDLLNLVNIAKAGNLPTPSIIAAIDGVAGVLFPPGNIDVPYASANASPPVVGTVCTVTVGNWAGTPSSYAYAWYRNGVVIAGATAATYTLVSADIGGKQITAVVTATNVTGSTAAPPSNAIAT
jgi:hypothetical protein